MTFNDIYSKLFKLIFLNIEIKLRVATAVIGFTKWKSKSFVKKFRIVNLFLFEELGFNSLLALQKFLWFQ